MTSNLHSSPVDETEPVSGTTSYAGVIRDADEAERMAVDAVVRLRLDLTERDATIERLEVLIEGRDDLLTQNDELRAALTRVEALCDEGDGYLSTGRVRAALKPLYADAPTEPDPELEREGDAPSGVTQHPCDCARHVSYREAVQRCGGVQAADDRRAL